MKALFNSLGSNYNLSFALKSLLCVFIGANEQNKDRLVKKLERIYQGRAILCYKGRDALEFALKSLGVSASDKVLIQAFSCWAIEEAVRRSGAKPLFTDTAKGSLNLSLNSLKKIIKKEKSIKVVIVQHTLGHPADIEKIGSYLKEKKIFLIEDLAQAVGGKSVRNKMLGLTGDAVVFSFGRDKMLDAVNGGACVIRNNVKIKVPEIMVKKVPQKQVRKDLAYPLITLIIRTTYPWLLGKVLHSFFKKIKLISSPVESLFSQIHDMPQEMAFLALQQFARLEKEILSRRSIAASYFSNFESLIPASKKQIENGANLRIPLLVKNPEQLISCLKEKKIFLADRWYKQPIDCGSLQCDSLYRMGSCPNAEEFTKKVVNLPTHRNIRSKDVRRIVKEIKKCLN